MGANKNSPPPKKLKKPKKTQKQKKMNHGLGALTNESLADARKVEMDAMKLTKPIHVKDPKVMEIRLAFTNKEETPDLQLEVPPKKAAHHAHVAHATHAVHAHK